jgi:hypothetical protein
MGTTVPGSDGRKTCQPGARIAPYSGPQCMAAQPNDVNVIPVHVQVLHYNCLISHTDTSTLLPGTSTTSTLLRSTT